MSQSKLKRDRPGQMDSETLETISEIKKGRPGQTDFKTLETIILNLKDEIIVDNKPVSKNMISGKNCSAYVKKKAFFNQKQLYIHMSAVIIMGSKINF